MRIKPERSLVVDNPNNTHPHPLQHTLFSVSRHHTTMQLTNLLVLVALVGVLAVAAPLAEVKGGKACASVILLHL
jgi:hypothetical protein